MEMKKIGNKEYVFMSIALVLLNFLIKGLYISNNSIGGDEPFSIYYAQMDIGSIINCLSAGNNPPFYEIFLHFWVKLFGISELSVRLPSLIFSSITVFYIYKLGVKHLNNKIAIYSGIIFIFSNYHILLTHESRSYALLGMLTIMSMYYFLGLISLISKPLDGTNKSAGISVRKYYFALILVNIILIYTHYFGFFVLIVQVLFFLFYKKLIINYWKQFLIMLGILVLLFSPNIVVFFTRFYGSYTTGTYVMPPKGFDSIYGMLRTFSNVPVIAASLILVFLSAIIRYIIKRKTETSGLASRLVVFWFVFIFFFMFGISYLIPMFIDRYLMPASIAFCLLAGISIDYIIRIKRIEYIIPGLICLLFIVSAHPNISNKRNVRDTVAKIKEIKGKETLVLICPKDFILNYAYYYDQNIFKKYDNSSGYINIYESLKSENVFVINTINDVDYKKWKDIIYLDAGSDYYFPGNNIKSTIGNDYNMESRFEFYEIFNVYKFNLK